MKYYDKEGVELRAGDLVMDYQGSVGQFEEIDGCRVIRFGGSNDYGKLVPGKIPILLRFNLVIS